ncbi:HupE/UreJ family protein [Microbaculum marinum]|uniref:HupE/UreJ family protein n=1 Tax=Microbaculum marinum TaxID=1764581 RepID=UPI00360A6A7D
MRERLSVAGLVVASALLPQSALAHGAVPGIMGFYSGFLHPLISFDQLLALLALSVMCGLAPKPWFGRSWLVFATVAIVGICFGLLGYQDARVSPALMAIGFVAAGLAALRPSGVQTIQILLSALAGALVGVSSAPDPGPVRDMIITACGGLVGANYILLAVVGGICWFRDRFDHEWSLIAVRIIAAWIATISISMAALALTPR